MLFLLFLVDKDGDFLTSQRPCLITGEGLGSQKSEQEAQAIHKENLEKLRSMSEEEILQEQARLLAQLGMCFPGSALEMRQFIECVGVLKS